LTVRQQKWLRILLLIMGATVSAGLLAWAVSVAFRTVALVLAHQVIVPFWDQWYEVTPGQQLGHFFRRNAEHVVAVARVVYILDYFFARGRNTFDLGVIFLVQAFQSVLFATLFVACQNRRFFSLTTAAASGLIVASLFNPVQWENFAWGLQVQFALVYLLGVAAFVILAAGRPSWQNDVFVILLAVAAALTMANGVLVSPIVVGLALLFGARRATVLRLTLSIVIGWSVLGVAHLFKATSGDFRAPLNLDQMRSLQFLFALLGSPFMGCDRWSSAVVVGAVGVCIFVGAACLIIGTAIFRRDKLRLMNHAMRAQLAFLAVAAFSFGSSGMIAIGRSFQGMSQAFASRYSTPPILFWLSLTLILIATISPSLQVPTALLASLGACILAATWLDFVRPVLRDRELSLRETETAMLAGVPDWLAYSAAGPKSWTSIPQTVEMQEAGLSVFSETWAKWLGRPAADYLSVHNVTVCKGELESMEEVAPGAWRLSGWSSHGPRLIVVDDRGIVVGYGMTGIPRPDLQGSHSGVTVSDIGWIGQARIPEGASITILAVGPRGRGACPITDPRPVEDQTVAAMLESSDFGPVRISLEGGWTKASGSVDGRPLPFRGIFFESYNGRDSNVGKLTMSFHITAHDPEINIPFATGASSRDLGMILRLARSGTEINEWTLPIQRSWSTFTLRIPDVFLQSGEGQDVVLDVLDYGSGPGQWIAVGLPQKHALE
jgi:hypothetical protein